MSTSKEAVRPLQKLREKYVVQYFLPLAMTLLVLVLATTRVTYQPVDFYVYYDAAKSTFSSGNIYAQNIMSERLPDGGLPFVYTPFTLVLLLPFTWLPPMLAWATWTFLTLVTLAWALRFLCRSATVTPPTWLPAVLFISLIGTTVIAQHLVFGQINIFLAAACLYDLACDNEQRPRWLPRGLLVGIAAGIKLTPAFFLVFLIVTRQFKAAAWMCLGGLGTIVVGAIVFPVSTWHYFTTSILSLSNKVDLGSNFATSGNSSILGTLAYFSPDAPFLLKAILIALVTVVILTVGHRLVTAGRTLDAVLMTGASIQLLSPVSWIHHWVFVVFVALRLCLEPRTRRWGVFGLFFLLLQPTDLGDWILASAQGNILLTAIGTVFREGLLLLTLILSGVLALLSSSFSSRSPLLSGSTHPTHAA